MNIQELQQKLFLEIKSKLPVEASVADETAKLLDISSDSIYRRMRGEKTISFDELFKLCTHYNISLDQMMNISSEAYPFLGKMVSRANFSFNDYITSLIQYLVFITSFKNHAIYYLCKDIPIFYLFQFREIAAFKYYFWMKTLLRFPEFTSRQFSFDIYPDETFEMEKKALDLYTLASTYEIWNVESITVHLRQIEFYRESRMFRSDKDVFRINEAFERLIDHIEKQASLGYRFEYGDAEMKPRGQFNMYFNEVIIGDNSQLAVFGEYKMAFISHSIFNFMMTRDIRFCDYVNNNIKSLMERSTLISGVSERERGRFFRIMREKIARRKDSLKV